MRSWEAAVQHRVLFPQVSKYRAERGLELVHSDLCGPIKPATAGSNRYFLVMVGDHSRFMWIEVLKSKDEAFKRFKRVKALAKATPSRKLLAF